MTAVKQDTKSEAQLQAASASKTLENVAEARARATEPSLQRAKLFRCAASSMQMIMSAGKIIVFKDGRFVTDRPDEVEYLEGEIRAGNTMLYAQVEEVEPEKTLAQMKEEIEVAAIERFIRDVKGGSGNAGTSNQVGAGMMASSAVESETPAEKMERLKAEFATAVTPPADLVAPAPNPVEEARRTVQLNKPQSEADKK